MVEQDLSIGKRYRNAIRKFRAIKSWDSRKDSSDFQHRLRELIDEFTLIQTIVNRLHLFSDNETLQEVNTNYIPFLNTSFYLGSLYTDYSIDKGVQSIDAKVVNLQRARSFYIQYLIELQQYQVLTKSQSQRLDGFKRLANPSIEEVVQSSNNPTQRRQEKIENFRLEKELNQKLEILNEYYEKTGDNEEDESSFSKFDEETVLQIYTDQLRLHSIETFNMLESITMELKVLENRPKIESIQPEQPQDSRSKDNSAANDYGYTPRLENLPSQATKVSDLISKQGKILRPFTITSDRQQLKEKVFGTGQVLPSMTVEEYLDYELANGKMMKEEAKDTNESDTDNSDDELEKRRWDDWKDENPKGSGNMKANIG